MGTVLLSVLMTSPLPAKASEDGSIKIESPKNGETLKDGQVTIKWKQEKLGRGNHVHIIIDKGYERPVREGTSKKLKLTKGKHEITVKAYSYDHVPLEPQDSIEVDVE